MDNFFIDKLGHDGGDVEKEKGENIVDGTSDEGVTDLCIQEMDLFDEPPDRNEYKEKRAKRMSDFSLKDTYLITNYKTVNDERAHPYANVVQILEKSVLKPGLEKQNVVPPEKSERILKMQRKKQSKKTKGKEWFEMPAKELTKEVVTDFKLLRMRSALDRKYVYKKNDITHMPKYFHVGKVIESPSDFYSSRIPKLQRKKTFMEELLADAEFKRYQKKKFKEIMDENRRRKQTKTNKLDKKGYKKK